MQQTLSIAEAQAIIATPKFAVRPIKWQKKQGNYIPARFHFESILQIKTTIREDLLLRLSYRGAYNISRAGIAIARDANITAGLYVANHRISAYDYDTTKPHINHIGAGLPYHRQHITGLHRHIWTNEGDGYAEPLLLTDCQPATIIRAFVTDKSHYPARQHPAFAPRATRIVLAMKTDILKQLTAWQPINQTANSVTLASPLTFGTDGSSISFTILFPQENHFVLTDFGDYALLAEQMGAKLDPKRYQSINHTNGIRFASFNEDGEIQATGNVADLSAALADATKLALALSFRLPKWLPKFNQIRFRSMVETVLRRDIPAQNIVKDYKTTGISGHQLVFPFALTTPERNVLIEPIALKDGKIDWASVYQAHGKFSDLKRLDTHNKRLAILEGDETSEYGAAATVLGDSCHVRTLNTTTSWQLQHIIH